MGVRHRHAQVGVTHCLFHVDGILPVRQPSRDPRVPQVVLDQLRGELRPPGRTGERRRQRLGPLAGPMGPLGGEVVKHPRGS